MSVTFLQWGDVPTWGLFAGAVVTTIFAIKAFRKQSAEVSILERQALDQQELTKQQAELLKVQSAQLDLQRQRLEQQRSAARIVGWEAAIRDLSLYLGSERKVLWTASDYFPLGREGVDPPEFTALIETGDSFRRLCMHLLEVLGILPREFAKKVLPVTMRLVEAESEITALTLAMIGAMETGRAESRATWQWADAQRAHEVSDDQERSESWNDIVVGRKFQAAEEEWEQLSSNVEDHLHDIDSVMPQLDNLPRSL